MNRSVDPNRYRCESSAGHPAEVAAEDPKAPNPALVLNDGMIAYEGYARIIDGRGTICIPLAVSGEVGSPRDSVTSPRSTTTAISGPVAPATNLVIGDPRFEDYFGLSQGLNYELVPEEEIRQLWDQVVQESNKQVTRQLNQEIRRDGREKSEKLEMLLMIAINSGNIDLAMLLISGLETREVNKIAGNLMGRMQELQQQRRQMSGEMGKLGQTPEDQKKIQQLNLQIGDIGTEMQMLQIFLQDLMSQKQETQQMASNYIKSRHDTAMGILRNSG